MNPTTNFVSEPPAGPWIPSWKRGRLEAANLEELDDRVNALSSYIPSNETDYSTPPQSPSPTYCDHFTPDRRKMCVSPLSLTNSRNFYTEKDWYQKIAGLVNEVYFLSKTRSPKRLREESSYEEKPEEIENEILGKIEQLKLAIKDVGLDEPKDLLILLKLLSANPFCGIEPLFYEVFDNLREKLPGLNAYVKDIRGNENEGPVFTPEGVRTIIDFFKREYKFSDDILSCQPTTALPRLVRNLIEVGQEGQIAAWAVYAISSEDRHIVPVFAIYHNNKAHVFIFDSAGHVINPNYPELSTTSKSLDTLRADRTIDADKIEIYSYIEKRQNGHVECSIFTLFDLKSLIEMHSDLHADNIVEYYNAQQITFTPRLITPEMAGETNPAKQGRPFYEINLLPPAMMKLTQSISFFQTLRDRYSEEWGAYNTQRSNLEGEFITETQNVDLLYKRVDQYTSCDPDGHLRNLSALKKRFNCMIYLVLQILDPQAADVKFFEEQDGNR